MSKYNPSATEMPKDPNNVTSGKSLAYDESSNRPRDVNDVTSGDAPAYDESSNRPAKPSNA